MRHATIAVAIAVAVAGFSTTSCKPVPPPPPPPKPAGTITITTTPAGAAVYKDRRERLGVTPLELTRPDGSLMNLTLVKDGHENRQITVMVESGKKKKVHQDLSSATGTVLVDAQLYGPVVHLAALGSTVMAATEMGDHLAWELGVLDEPYCALLQQIWSEVPVVWRTQGLRIEGPPAGHACRLEATEREP